MNRKFLRIIVFVVSVIIACLVSFAHAQPGKGKYLIMIDPAHGGKEKGVMLSDKYSEKDLVLAIALAIQKELGGSGKFQVQLTRSADIDMPIQERVKKIQSVHADLFINLHANAGFGKQAAGYEVYFPGFSTAPSGKGGSTEILKDMERNKYLNDSVKFAQIVQKNLQSVFPRKGRGLRDAHIPILSGLTMPSIVLEIAFATNPEDNAKLMDSNTQQAIVQSLTRSIKDYFSF
jgi:N-acetylmuramoyl-L-alanine amidase